MKGGVLVLFCLFYVCSFYSINAQVISTVAGNGSGGFSGDGGSATAAQINFASGIATDAAHNLYIADYGNSRIRKLTGAGIITTIAGIATAYYSGDGGVATVSSLNLPQDIAVTALGRIYIADAGNNVIRMIDAAGIITTVAGNGTPGFSGDGNAATGAQLDEPTGIAVDMQGNLYIADYNNYRIRKVDTNGVITTFAGSGTGAGAGVGGYSGDGGLATLAELFYPSGVAADGAGNVYIADYQNNAVRKVNAYGIISTVAGTGVAGYSGDGSLATAAHVSSPSRVAVDGAGNLYIADAGNNRIRKVNTIGIINTIAGTSTAGYGGDGGVATAAMLNRPAGMTIDATGRVYLADENNSRIRVINSTDLGPVFIGGASQVVTVCENSLFNDISSLLAIRDSDIGEAETWSIAALPAHGSLEGFSETLTSAGSSLMPADLAYVPATGYSGSDVFTINVSDGRVTVSTVIHVTVSGAPAPAPITGVSAMCATDSTRFSDAVGGGLWSSATGAMAIAGDGEAQALTTGIDTVEYTVANTCGTTTVKKVVTVNPMADAGIIIGSNTVCTGDTLAFAAASLYAVIDSGGVWSTSNSSATITTGGGVLTAISTDTVTVIFTVANSCNISVATFALAINAAPDAGSILGLSALCEGYAIVLDDTGAAGGTWASSNASATVAYGVVVAVSAGVDTITYSVANTCGTAIARKIVTIDSAPVVGIITGPATLCEGATINLYDAVAGGTWSTNNASAGISGGGEVNGIAGGVDTVKYSIANSCGTLYAFKEITVQPLPDISIISGADTVCQTDSVIFTDSVAGGVWFSQHPSIATVGATGIVTAIAPGIDTIAYTLSNDCGIARKKKYVYVKSAEECSIITGVNSLTANAAALSVFPNPNDGSFELEVTSDKDETCTVVMTNLAGEKVQELKIGSNALTKINIRQPAGIYLLTATTARAMYMSKMVIY